MAFETSAAIQGNEYGKNVYDADKKKYKFVPLGKAVFIDSITENIESGEVRLQLKFDYMGGTKKLEIDRKSLGDPSLLQDLINVGADITKRYFNLFVDTLRLQEEMMAANKQATQKVYHHLGWYNIEKKDAAGNMLNELCYRASVMIGASPATYAGLLKVEPMGTFEAWRTMVQEEIIGYIPAEVVMLASLSAVINGLISEYTTGDNPIFSLNGLSGSGKSTLAMAGCSAFGEPFDGERRLINEKGEAVKSISAYGSWSATENAMLGRCAGNHGCLIVLNEVGKFRGDMSTIVYNLSEGTDKTRMTKNLNLHSMEGYHTTIISVGEQSILARCKDKADGLRVRVMELDMPLTKSSESADRIKTVSRANNGWAAPMMAQYIIDNGGRQMVLDIYEERKKALLAIWPDVPHRDRFVAKFPALLLTTAAIAEKALGLEFAVEEIIEWFVYREKAQGADRNSALSSFDILIEEFRINIANFFRGNIPPESSKTWGKAMFYENRELPDGRTLLEEYLVRRNVVNELLKKHGFSNLKTCIEAWQNAGVLSCDADRPTRSRIIDPDSRKKEEVFVFRVCEGELSKPKPKEPTFEQMSVKEAISDADAHTA